MYYDIMCFILDRRFPTFSELFLFLNIKSKLKWYVGRMRSPGTHPYYNQ